MDRSRKKRLQKAGWKVGDARELLGLSDEQAALIEVRLALASSLKQHRLAQGMTQQQLAEALGSSQSRVAKMETADPSVSIELLVRALFRLGTTRREVGRIIGRKSATPAA
jgi:predicted XRE-type DNA-binding protein